MFSLNRIHLLAQLQIIPSTTTGTPLFASRLNRQRSCMDFQATLTQFSTMSSLSVSCCFVACSQIPITHHGWSRYHALTLHGCPWHDLCRHSTSDSFQWHDQLVSLLLPNQSKSWSRREYVRNLLAVIASLIPRPGVCGLGMRLNSRCSSEEAGQSRPLLIRGGSLKEGLGSPILGGGIVTQYLAIVHAVASLLLSVRRTWEGVSQYNSTWHKTACFSTSCGEEKYTVWNH